MAHTANQKTLNVKKFDELVEKYEWQVAITTKEIYKLTEQYDDLKDHLRDAINIKDELDAEQIVEERAAIKREIDALETDKDLYIEFLAQLHGLTIGEDGEGNERA